MGRYALNEKTGRALKGQGRKQLNALLPEQLVLDFNEVAKEHGRDTLLKNVMLSYLQKVAPESESVRAHQEQEDSAAVKKLMDGRKAVKLNRAIEEREALRLSRQYAEAIIEVTLDVGVGRKDPKRAPQRAVASRKRRAS
jgi:hypothetical protein